MRRNVKASWDEGWSGRYVHSLGQDDAPSKSTITVNERDDEILLYVEFEGEKFRICRKQKVGF